MIAHVFLAQPARAKNSTELDLAYESLCRALPDGATLVHLDAVDAIGLWRAAGAFIQGLEHDKHAASQCSLLLSSRYLYITPSDIKELSAACIALNAPVVAPSNQQTF